MRKGFFLSQSKDEKKEKTASTTDSQNQINNKERKDIQSASTSPPSSPVSQSSQSTLSSNILNSKPIPIAIPSGVPDLIYSSDEDSPGSRYEACMHNRITSHNESKTPFKDTIPATTVPPDFGKEKLPDLLSSDDEIASSSDEEADELTPSNAEPELEMPPLVASDDDEDDEDEEDEVNSDGIPDLISSGSEDEKEAKRVTTETVPKTPTPQPVCNIHIF